MTLPTRLFSQLHYIFVQSGFLSASLLEAYHTLTLEACPLEDGLFLRASFFYVYAKRRFTISRIKNLILPNPISYSSRESSHPKY